MPGRRDRTVQRAGPIPPGFQHTILGGTVGVQHAIAGDTFGRRFTREVATSPTDVYKAYGLLHNYVASLRRGTPYPYGSGTGDEIFVFSQYNWRQGPYGGRPIELPHLVHFGGNSVFAGAEGVCQTVTKKYWRMIHGTGWRLFYMAAIYVVMDGEEWNSTWWFPVRNNDRHDPSWDDIVDKFRELFFCPA